MSAATPLKTRAWISLGALASEHGASSLIRLAGNLITTRLLVPELFGVMAVFGVIVSVLEMLSDTGIRQSVIRSPNADTPEFRKTAWTLQIGRAGVLFLTCQVIAGLLWSLQHFKLATPGTVYAEPVLPLVVSVGSLSVLLRGFNSIGGLYRARSVQFGRVVLYGIMAQCAATGSVVVWALIDPSIRALVGGTILGAAISLVLSHILFPVRPISIGWDHASGAELRHMARWMIVASVFGSIARHGDTLLLGIFVSTAGLGFFSIANLLVTAVAVGLSKFQEVWFAALSEIARDSGHRLSDVYYRIRRLQDPLVVAIFLLLATQGERIVALLYDQRYLSTGAMFQILSLAILAQIYELQARMLIVAEKQDQFWKKTATEAVVTLTINLAILATLPVGYALVAIAVKPLWGLWLPFREFSKMGLIRWRYELVYLAVVLALVVWTLWVVRTGSD